MTQLSPELIKKIRRIEIETGKVAQDLLAGAYRSAFKGKGMEFEENREYQTGDETRDIDWKVTARMDRPYVKVYREEREISVFLMVDVSASSQFGRDRSKSELIAEIGAFIAFSAIKNHDKIGLILFSDKIEKYLPPSKGSRHVLRLIRELLAYGPQSKGTNISGALSFLGKINPKSSVCFLLSDFISPDFSHEAALIAKKHDLIAISIVDPLELNFPNLGLIEARDLEDHSASIIDTSIAANREHLHHKTSERLQACKRLMNKIGAGYIEIHTEKPYFQEFKKFFKTRSLHRK